MEFYFIFWILVAVWYFRKDGAFRTRLRLAERRDEIRAQWALDDAEWEKDHPGIPHPRAHLRGKWRERT